MTLFDEVSDIFERYDSAVLTYVEANGYPLSIRCQPIPDKNTKTLSLSLARGVDIPAGEASLLCHSHDDLLNNLHSVSIRGKLDKQDSQYLFHPEELIYGLGNGNFFKDVIQNAILHPGRNAKRFLTKHNLERPKIDWDKLRKLADE